MPTFKITTYEPSTTEYEYIVEADSLLQANQAVLEQQGNFDMKLVSTTWDINGKITIVKIVEINN